MKPVYRLLLPCILACSLARAQAPSADAAPNPANELGLPSLPPERLKALLKPLPARAPDDAIKAMEIIPGFHAEIVAAEPDVINPAAGAIDENGLFYVCELIDYPYKAAEGEKPKGRVRVLEDLDGDGRYEQATVFADGLLWTAGIAPWKGGVFVTAPPDIWYMKDTDGDRVADVREKVFTGFGTSGAQYIMNNLQWGLDHKIYLSVAGNGGTVTQLKHPEAEPMNVGGGDVRFDPETLVLERISGGKQFGNTFDDWGNRFMCDESDALIHVVLPLEYLQRNPYLRVENVKNTIVGGPTPIFRISPVETWRAIRSARRLALGERDPGDAGLSHNVLDGVAGTTIYRGDAYPPQYRGTVFVNDAQNNLIHHRTLEPDGVTFKSERIEQGTEFLRSKDNWFRPVNLLNAPDGTLYSFDLAREILEAVHIPMDVVQYLDLTSGRDRGRIWRIAPDGFKAKAPPKLGELSTAELVGLLESDNGWTRDTASRLIYERQDAAVEEPLRKVLKESAKPMARLHALWGLVGIEKIDDDAAKVAMLDNDEHLRERGIALAELTMPSLTRAYERITDSEKYWTSGSGQVLRRLIDDPAPRVQFQCALSFGGFGASELEQLPAWMTGRCEVAPTIGGRVLTHNSEDPWIRAAVFSSLRETIRHTYKEDDRYRPGLECPTYQSSANLLLFLISSPGFLDTAGSSGIISELAKMTGQIDRESNVHGSFFGTALDSDELRSRFEASLAFLEGYAAGYGYTDGNQFDFCGFSSFRDILPACSRLAADSTASTQSRIRAVKVLGLSYNGYAIPILAPLLDGAVPVAVQTETVRSLGRFQGLEVATTLLDAWRTAPPNVREEIIKVLLDKPERTAKLLDAIESGDIAPPEIPLTARKKMLELKDEALKARAEKLLPSAPSAERQEVIAKYKPALAMEGHADAGLAVFTKICAQCHKIGNVGQTVGPNLALESKPADELLMHILDPNHEVKPQYIQYRVTLTNDEEVDGVIASDTPSSVTIRRPNEELVIPRSQIASITSSKLSLMPEGLEQDLSLQDMSDLIAYLLGNQYDRGTAGKSGPEGKMLRETRK